MASNLEQRRMAVPQHPEKTIYISSEDSTSKDKKNISVWRRYPAFSMWNRGRRIRSKTTSIM
jgi:hypothetical protein